MAKTGILYCIDAVNPGGTETQLQGLCRHLDRDLFTPYVCTFRPFDPTAMPLACPLVPYEVARVVSLPAVGALHRLVRFQRRHNIRIMQSFFQDATVLGAVSARLAGVPVRLGSFRDMGFWRDHKQALLGRLVYPTLTGFIANSEAVRQAAYGFAGVRPGSIQVIRNGIDVGRFADQPDKPPEISVAIVGNFNREVKRTDLFIRAAAAVAPRFPAVKWYVTGEGHLEPALRRLAGELGVSSQVVFTGRMADIPGFLKKIHIGVNCSDSEGFSNAVTEYMLSGCAAVATRVGGNVEAIRDGESGLLVPPDDAAALAEALTTLLTNPELRRRLAAQGQAQTLRDFSWATCIYDHQTYYLEALELAQRAGGR